MGQKVNPIGFRVGVDHDWRSRWFADKRAFGDLLAEDNLIRDVVGRKLKDAAVSEKVKIEKLEAGDMEQAEMTFTAEMAEKAAEDIEKRAKRKGGAK